MITQPWPDDLGAPHRRPQVVEAFPEPPFTPLPTPRSRRRPRRAPRTRAVGVALVVAAVAAISFSGGIVYEQLGLAGGSVAAARHDEESAPVQVVQAPVNVPATPATPATRPGTRTVRRGAPPVAVTIPDLGIDRPLIGLRVKPNRELEVPKDYADVGWWSTGPAPGDSGAALLVGHVDSTRGPAVFAKLSTLKKGDIISVRRSGGATIRFVVRGSETFAKDAFPDEKVYRTTGRPSLHLVTCGGTYNRATGHYLDNVVVFADLVQPQNRSRTPRVRAPARATPDASPPPRATPDASPPPRATPDASPPPRATQT